MAATANRTGLDRLLAPHRRDGLASRHINAAARLYDEGWPLAQIATKFDATSSTVRASCSHMR